MVFAPSDMGASSAREASKQPLQPRPRAVDFLVQALRVAARRGELLLQLDVLGAQLLAQRHELSDLGLERAEFGFHAVLTPPFRSHYVAIFKLRQEVRGDCACVS